MTILTIIIYKKYVTITQDLLHKINCNRKNLLNSDRLNDIIIMISISI